MNEIITFLGTIKQTTVIDYLINHIKKISSKNNNKPKTTTLFCGYQPVSCETGETYEQSNYENVEIKYHKIDGNFYKNIEKEIIDNFCKTHIDEFDIEKECISIYESFQIPEWLLTSSCGKTFIMPAESIYMNIYKDNTACLIFRTDIENAKYTTNEPIFTKT